MPENPYAPPKAKSGESAGTNDQTRRPIWLGFVIAPWAPSTLFFAYALFDPQRTGLSKFLFAAFAAYGLVLPISYGVIAGIGLPYALWLDRRKLLTWPTICIGSTIIGCLCSGAFWLIGLQGQLLAFGSVLGLASGVTFCAVVRPNNSFKPKPLRGSA